MPAIPGADTLVPLASHHVPGDPPIGKVSYTQTGVRPSPTNAKSGVPRCVPTMLAMPL